MHAHSLSVCVRRCLVADWSEKWAVLRVHSKPPLSTAILFDDLPRLVVGMLLLQTRPANQDPLP